MAIYDSLTRPQIGLRHGVRRALSDGIGRLWLPHFIDGLRTAQDWSDLLGLTISNLYLFDEASGDVIDQVGGDDLTPSGIARGAATGWPRVGMEFGDKENDSCTAASSGVFDDGGSSQMFVLLAKMGDLLTNPNQIFGKSGGAPDYRCISVSGDIVFLGRDGTSTFAATVEGDHSNGILRAAVGIDYDADVLRVHTQHGSATADISGAASFANAFLFDFGAFAGASAPMTAIAFARIVGANAEGVDWGAVIAELSRGLP